MSKNKPTVHTALGGSSIERAYKCPSSVILSQIDKCKNPTEEEKSYTLKGTRMHEYAEAVLKRKTPGDIPPAELEALQGYVDWAEKEIEKGVKYFIEPKLYSKIDASISGSIDLLVVYKNSIMIADLKTGFMLKKADDYQLKLYAMLVYDNRKLLKISDKAFESVKLAIYQTTSKYTPNIYITDVEELEEYKEEIVLGTVKKLKKGIKKKLKGKDLKVSEGAYCKFCPVSLYCKTGGR